MALHLLIIHTIMITTSLVWVTKILPASSFPASSFPASSSAVTVANYNCTEKCGNFNIAFPFGIEPSCYFNEWFAIDCREQRVPFLKNRGINLEVLEFQQDRSRVQVNLPVIRWNCTTTTTTTSNGRINSSSSSSSNSSVDRGGIEGVDLVGSPFFFSETANIFVAVGIHCNSMAYLTDYDNKSMFGACVPSCGESYGDVYYDVYYNLDCCQTTLPPSLQLFRPFFKSSPEAETILSCRSYALLVSQDWFTNFTYNVRYSSDWMVQKEYVPAVLDFAFYNATSESIGVDNDTTDCKTKYRFQLNGTLSNNSTLQCSCVPPFYGNPYIPDGCQCT